MNATRRGSAAAISKCRIRNVAGRANLEIPFSNPGVPNFQGQGLDDMIAEQSGDVYFYSPESLDGSKFGLANERNLYVARRNGQVQLVGSLDPGTQVYRMTIARDGRFAAFLTDSQMTSYDNKGFRQVYTYERDGGILVCASCRPGAPPANDVSVSQGGKFMADDGRTFFDTKDSLVPRDKNGSITDTYEYAGGRPQLVSSGPRLAGLQRRSRNLRTLPGAATTGLEAVSRDGIDVYFSTFDTWSRKTTTGCSSSSTTPGPTADSRNRPSTTPRRRGRVPRGRQLTADPADHQLGRGPRKHRQRKATVQSGKKNQKNQKKR